jgi:O-antigen/teichoic acid export membrane protein
MVQYSKWIVLGSIAMNIMTRLDFYVVAKYFSFKEAGIYNAASQLVSVFMFFRIAYGKVFLPKVIQYSTLAEYRRYLKKVGKVGLVVAVCVLMVLPFARFIIKISFGEAFISASSIFQILLLSFLFTIWNVMIGQIFYSLGHAKYMAIGAFAQLLVFAIAGYFLVPIYQARGAACSTLISSIAYLLIILWFLKSRLRVL